MEHGLTSRLFQVAVLLPLGLVSCTGLDRVDQGRLQPQSVAGPCDVKKFFLTSTSATNTDMTISNVGSACTFTLINPDLQIINTAVLVTSPSSHGRADAALITGATQATVSYTPMPSYIGPDAFTVTLEPADRAVTVHVKVQPGRVAEAK